MRFSRSHHLGCGPPPPASRFFLVHSLCDETAHAGRLVQRANSSRRGAGTQRFQRIPEASLDLPGRRPRPLRVLPRVPEPFRLGARG
jgi:hypothetical protein